MRQSIVALIAFGMVFASEAQADTLEFDVKMLGGDKAGQIVSHVQAVDSWFTTLATLIFEMKGMPEGTYQMSLHEGAACEPVGPIYDPVALETGTASEKPLGAFPDFVVAADGSAPRTIGLKPPSLVSGAPKIGVLDMRGHALVFHLDGDPAACGLVPPLTE